MFVCSGKHLHCAKLSSHFFCTSSSRFRVHQIKRAQKHTAPHTPFKCKSPPIPYSIDGRRSRKLYSPVNGCPPTNPNSNVATNWTNAPAIRATVWDNYLVFVPNVVALRRPNAGWVVLNIDRISANGLCCWMTGPLTLKCHWWNSEDDVDLCIWEMENCRVFSERGVIMICLSFCLTGCVAKVGHI